MFGEKSIYGQSVAHLDDKKRMFLPKFTHASEGDVLLLVIDGEHLSIHSEQELEAKIKQKEEEYENCSSRLKKAKKRELLLLYSSIIKRVKCDKECRITLGNLNVLGDSSYVKCTGAREYLILEPEKEKSK